MAKYCTNCGKEIGEGNRACTNCGTMVDGFVPTTTTVNVNNIQPKSNGFATAGFVLSLISMLCCGSFSFISLILSIVGLVKAKECNGNGKGLAIAGIIISALFIIIFLVFMILGYGVVAVENIRSNSYY